MSNVPEELPLGRLEALSDGIFAIAITLLVLELAVGPDAAEDPLGAVLDEWPPYLAYVTSFLTIGAIWLAHSRVTSGLRAADATLYRLNLLVLLFVSFLPFPTKLAGDFVRREDAERVAAVLYGLTLLALVVSLTFLTRYVSERPELVRDQVDEDALAAARFYQPSYVFYAIAIAIAIAFLLPVLAVTLYLGIALYLAVPARTIRRLARRA